MMANTERDGGWFYMILLVIGMIFIPYQCMKGCIDVADQIHQDAPVAPGIGR